MLTILTTGSNGLLGQKITDLCLKTPDIKLIATAKGENRHPANSGYIYEEMDIANHEQVESIIQKHKPVVVINAGAMTNVDACETQRELCMALNVYAVENLAKLSERLNFHLVHISTDFIFDGTKKMYTEMDDPNPLSFYGMSKWEGEKKIFENAEHYVILRTVLVYGVVADMSRSNIVLWAYKMLKEQSPAKVVDDQFRTPTLAEDLAMGCLLAAQKKAHGIYNISGKDFMSVYELVERVASFFKLNMTNVSRVKSDSLNQPAKRPPITGLDITKARKELGYEPHSFEQGLQKVKEQMGL